MMVVRIIMDVLVGKSILVLKAGLLPELEQFSHGFTDLTTSNKRDSAAPLGNQLQPSRLIFY